MSAYALLEAAVIALALGFSLWTLLGRFAPAWRQALLRRLGRSSAPLAAAPACDSGCPRCTGCAEGGSATAPREQVVRFQR